MDDAVKSDLIDVVTKRLVSLHETMGMLGTDVARVTQALLDIAELQELGGSFEVLIDLVMDETLEEFVNA